MAYIKTKWVDNQTLVNAENLNKIEDCLSDLMGVDFLPSPNLWAINMTTSDMTDKFYSAGGQPVDGFEQFPATEKIYLKEFAPTGYKLSVDMKRNQTYTFCCIPSLPTGYNTPWGTSLSHKFFFYDENDAFISTGFVSGSNNTFLVPATAVYFRFNIHTIPSTASKTLENILIAMNSSLMVVEGSEIPTTYTAANGTIEVPKGSVLKLMDDLYKISPNKWGITLSMNDLSGKYYMSGEPYTASTQFDAQYQATEKIYLKGFEPAGETRVVDLQRNETYRFYSLPTLPNGYTTPWSSDLATQSRIFFYDSSDAYVGHGLISGTVDTVKVPSDATHFRFNIAKKSSNFEAVINAINSSLMVYDANEEYPTKYTKCGELLQKAMDVSIFETRPIFYNLNADVLNVVSHFNETKDLRYEMYKKGPNNIFDYGKFYLIPVTATGEVSSDLSSESPTWSWSGTDSHAPFVVKAVNNADGDCVNTDGSHKSHFTGGNHGYDNTGSTENNTATGRTASIKVYADGKQVVAGSGYCNQLKVCWDNYIQGANTTKSDGSGREILREVHESIFDGNEWKEEIHLYPLEEINLSTWYGIQCIGLSGAWKNGYYKGSKEANANRSLLTFESGTNFNGNSNSKTSTRFVAFDSTKQVELEIDSEYDLGSGYMSNSEFRGFISGSKFYFWIIKSGETMLPNTCYGLKAFYRFKPVI